MAYWQALSAASLATETDELIELTRDALDRSRQLQEQGLQQPLTAMQYQEGLLSTLRSLLQLRQQLSTARTELSSLMNIRPGDDLDLMPSDEEVEAPDVVTELAELEDFGLLHRPELVEEDLRVRISSEEIKKAMLRMLPGLEIDAGAHYDSNKFLVNNSWSNAGIRISWNLLNLISGPSQKKRAEAQFEVDKTRRLATSMAVLTQINVAYERFLLAKKDFELATTLQKVKEEISQDQRTRRQAAVSDEFAEIRARLDALVAKLQRDQALAELQNSVGRIYNSIGLDPLPPEVTGYDVATLAGAIDEHQTAMKGMLVQPHMDPAAYDRIATQVKYERAVSDKEAAETAMAEAEQMRMEREQAAAAAREEALAAQRLAIEAALLEADGNRSAAQYAAEEAARLAEQQAAAAAAREAAEMAAAQAAAAEEAAEASRLAAEEAAAQQAAEAERLAAEVQAKIDAAVEAAVLAGAARNSLDEATEAVEDARQKADSIMIPETPGDAPADTPEKSSGIEMPMMPVVDTAPAEEPEKSSRVEMPMMPVVDAAPAEAPSEGWLYNAAGEAAPPYPTDLRIQVRPQDFYAPLKLYSVDSKLMPTDPSMEPDDMAYEAMPLDFNRTAPTSFADKDPFTNESLIQ